MGAFPMHTTLMGPSLKVTGGCYDDLDTFSKNLCDVLLRRKFIDIKHRCATYTYFSGSKRIK
jgi:hypothetical protein